MEFDSRLVDPRVLETLRKALGEVWLGVKSLTVESGEILSVPSGTEVAFRNVTIYGRMTIKGVIDVYGDLDVAGEFDVIGEVNVGV
jgi:hypothetical protein